MFKRREKKKVSYDMIMFPILGYQIQLMFSILVSHHFIKVKSLINKKVMKNVYEIL